MKFAAKKNLIRIILDSQTPKEKQQTKKHLDNLTKNKPKMTYQIKKLVKLRRGAEVVGYEGPYLIEAINIDTDEDCVLEIDLYDYVSYINRGLKPTDTEVYQKDVEARWAKKARNHQKMPDVFRFEVSDFETIDHLQNYFDDCQE